MVLFSGANVFGRTGPWKMLNVEEQLSYVNVGNDAIIVKRKWELFDGWNFE